MSNANILEKQRIKSKLSKMTLKVNDLKTKGLKRMMIEKEDKYL
jgi:hypothetical protein